MIVLYLGEYAAGGVATYLRTLIDMQEKNPKIEKIILMVSDFKSEQFQFESDKVQVIRYRYKRGLHGIFTILHQWPTILKVKPDIVHLHSTFAGLIRVRALLSFKHLHFGIVYCAHGWAFNQRVSALSKDVYIAVERVLSRVGYIINISQDEQDSAVRAGISENHMVMIHNAIQYSKMPRKHSAHQGTKFLFIGRFDRQKGLDVLLSAFQRLPRKYELSIAGGSILDDDKKTYLSNRRNVNYLGWLSREQIANQLLQSDALIVPSRWEGFGLVALEAMANSTAVIASKVGGLPEIVVQELTGILVPPEDPNALYQVLSSVTKEELETMGRAGRQRIERLFNPQKMERQVFDVYNAEFKLANHLL
ncbi:glycosyltransferase [Levilactobacillus suantsaiihabitans]|uniref:Glycosyltransferase family 1 protein n=1 Tax=Levilactobacillus suantsaiihabitans TaxID=2487722 RepID=A0A4Z0J6N1_9LACO|nr:glycosyltransferase [Levilactobacillus suantsaiihabitans]TGD17402.1 glycosyltransferase family 1 protein [Levilactobacillus suantsaiihabitans]